MECNPPRANARRELKKAEYEEEGARQDVHERHPRVVAEVAVEAPNFRGAIARERIDDAKPFKSARPQGLVLGDPVGPEQRPAGGRGDAQRDEQADDEGELTTSQARRL